VATADADRLLAEAAAAPTRGWDFSWLGDRIRTQAPPWDYDRIVCAWAATSPDLLDLGTGGGEWLAVLPCRPPRVVATEGYAPNFPVALERLGPLGIDVVVADAPDNVAQTPGATEPRLPFDSGSFSLIAARHEAYLPAEVTRVLRPGGTFVTQQVGERNEDDVHALLGRPAPPPTGWNVRFAARQLEAAGLDVGRAEEAEIETTFADVGAFAWWLRMISFSIPFSLDDDRERLVELHRAGAPLAVRERRFLVEAQKPA
jgi:SAM-dependent methyltransferase